MASKLTGVTTPPTNPQTVKVRRAPKPGPFVLLGIAVGFVVTIILTSLYPADPSVGFAALAGYFSIFGVSAGLVVGLTVWLLLDWRSKKAAKSVHVSRETH